MPDLNKVFRVRVTTLFEKRIQLAHSTWRRTHRWQRPGVFYRQLLHDGLKAASKKK